MATPLSAPPHSVASARAFPGAAGAGEERSGVGGGVRGRAQMKAMNHAPVYNSKRRVHGRSSKSNDMVSILIPS
jgi:hypothetical protein